jgi:hypothetical protein
MGTVSPYWLDSGCILSPYCLAGMNSGFTHGVHTLMTRCSHADDSLASGSSACEQRVSSGSSVDEPAMNDAGSGQRAAGPIGTGQELSDPAMPSRAWLAGFVTICH